MSDDGLRVEELALRSTRHEDTDVATRKRKHERDTPDADENTDSLRRQVASLYSENQALNSEMMILRASFEELQLDYGKKCGELIYLRRELQELKRTRGSGGGSPVVRPMFGGPRPGAAGAAMPPSGAERPQHQQQPVPEVSGGTPAAIPMGAMSARQQPPPASGRYFVPFHCALCNVSVSSESSMMAHLHSRKHKKREMQAALQQRGGAPDGQGMSTAQSHASMEDAAEFRSPSETPSHMTDGADSGTSPDNSRQNTDSALGGPPTVSPPPTTGPSGRAPFPKRGGLVRPMPRPKFAPPPADEGNGSSVPPGPPQQMPHHRYPAPGTYVDAPYSSPGGVQHPMGGYAHQGGYGGAGPYYGGYYTPPQDASGYGYHGGVSPLQQTSDDWVPAPEEAS